MDGVNQADLPLLPDHKPLFYTQILNKRLEDHIASLRNSFWRYINLSEAITPAHWIKGKKNPPNYCLYFDISWVLHLNKLKSLQFMMLWAMIGWNRPGCSREDFQKSCSGKLKIRPNPSLPLFWPWRCHLAVAEGPGFLVPWFSWLLLQQLLHTPNHPTKKRQKKPNISDLCPVTLNHCMWISEYLHNT